MYFKDVDDFQATLGAFLVGIMDSPSIAKAFSANNALIRIEFSDPESVMWIDCRGASPLATCEAGAYSEEPDLLLSMTADNGHRFWLGKLSLPVALTSRKVKAKGPISMLMKLLPALKPVFREYEAFLLQAGRNDLVTV